MSPCEVIMFLSHQGGRNYSKIFDRFEGHKRPLLAPNLFFEAFKVPDLTTSAPVLPGAGIPGALPISNHHSSPRRDSWSPRSQTSWRIVARLRNADPLPPVRPRPAFQPQLARPIKFIIFWNLLFQFCWFCCSAHSSLSLRRSRDSFRVRVWLRGIRLAPCARLSIFPRFKSENTYLRLRRCKSSLISHFERMK